MNANSAYAKYRETVEREAANIKRPLEISQGALWAKAIAINAFAGKVDGACTFGGNGTQFGFSEPLVNLCIEYAMRSVYEGRDQKEWEEAAFKRGYEVARREFARATGLYTEDDIDEVQP